MPPSKKNTIKEPNTHKLADKLTEIIIYFIVIFSLWAFGTTEPWSTWTMNISAYALGFLLLTKWFTRWKTDYKAWGIQSSKNESIPRINRLRLAHKYCNFLLTACMFLILAYILISAINARSTFDLVSKEFTYFSNFNNKLPHSYNANATWFLFWQYLGLTILFWGVKDWVTQPDRISSSPKLNDRERKLLLLICINGGILALECILQRIYYSEFRGKLLFIIEPVMNWENISQFGPFAYRSNACSYLNIIWPLQIGFFIHLTNVNLTYKKMRYGQGKELFLIPFCIVTVSSPVISSSRGGALITFGLILLILFVIAFLGYKSKLIRIFAPLTLLLGLIISIYLGWENIEPRMVSILTDKMSNREQIYETTINMINDYGIFGSGPGSFEAVIQFELNDSLKTWESWAHNDYLELYLTFGIFGFIIIFILFLALLIKYILYILVNGFRTWQVFGGISFIGIIIHSLADFPLQTHSILILLCILSSLLTYNEKILARTNNSTIKNFSF